MTKEEFFLIASPTTILNISSKLDDGERDILKYKVSRLCAEQLKDDFDLNDDPVELERFNIALNSLAILQPYKDRIPEYGIAYKGRPQFMTAELVADLQEEAKKFRSKAVVNIDQYLSGAETDTKDSVAEKLEDLDLLHSLVNQYAGPCMPSFISNYIYYDSPGQCSKPHVDNDFTAITVMIGLEHRYQNNTETSASVSYWANKPRYDYRLAPGELAIFFGASTLHGRTPVADNEIVNSLLLSYRPVV